MTRRENSQGYIDSTMVDTVGNGFQLCPNENKETDELKLLKNSQSNYSSAASSGDCSENESNQKKEHNHH